MKLENVHEVKKILGEENRPTDGTSGKLQERRADEELKPTGPEKACVLPRGPQVIDIVQTLIASRLSEHWDPPSSCYHNISVNSDSQSLTVSVPLSYEDHIGKGHKLQIFDKGS